MLVWILVKMKDKMKKTINLILVSILLISFLTVKVSHTTAQTPFRFISWSDAQDQGVKLPITSNQAVTLSPAFTIFNGDFEYDGFQLSEMNIMVNALNGDTSGNTNNGMFNITFLVRGNHDDHYSNPIEWQNYLVQANRPPVPGVTHYTGIDANSTYLTYAFDYGNSRFIGVDVPGDASDLSAAQITWIDDILTDAEANHSELVHAFIYFHGPIYCISYHCSCSAVNDPACIPPEVTSLISVFNRHPIVSATFHGHEHNLAWTHIDSNRITGVTHAFEQFLTSPSGDGSADSYLKPLRVDYAAMISTRGFASIDVNESEYTINFYQNGITSPVWSKTFNKSGSYPTPPPTPTPTQISSTTPSSVMTISAQVSSSSDDAEESVSSKSMYLDSTDLELVTDGSTVQLVGIRFNNLNIPQGATITDAYVEFEVDETGSTATTLRIIGQADDNPTTFAATTGNISVRPKTAAQVAWTNIAPWDTVHAKKQTPDISSIIQEIINRPGWTSGNSLALMIEGSGTRTAEAYDGEIPAAPKLIVSYTTNPSPTPTPTPSSTPTPSPTSTPILTPDSSSTPTPSDTPTPALSPSFTPTPIPTSDPSPTSTPSDTPTPVLSPSFTPTPTPTPSSNPTPTLTLTQTPTLVLSPTPTPIPTSVNLNPIADSYVRSDKPANNYGTNTTADVDGSPKIITYMKFNLSTLAGRNIRQAKLRLKVANDASSATQTVKAVADTSWSEIGITYNNRPILGSSINSFTSPKTNTWVEIDITSLVIGYQGQMMSIGIEETDSNSMNIYTRETNTNKPTLSVSFP